MAESRDTRTVVLGDHPWVRGVLITAVTIIAIGAAARTITEAGVLLSSVLVPIAVAVLLSGLMMPFVVLLNHKLKFPRSLAAATTILSTIAAIVGLLWVASAQLAEGFSDITEVISQQITNLRDWVTTSLPIGREQLSEALGQAQTWLADNQASLAQGVVGAGATAASFFVAAILTLVATFFFLSQGDRIWAALVVLLPKSYRRRLFESSRRGWVTLGTYCRTQLLVAGVDAVGIGLGAFVLGVPFVIPLTVITFVLCFIPFVGAIVSGALVVLMALAFQGWTTALIMLAIVVAVQQLESNVLSPILMGRAVDVHPLLVLVSVLASTYMFGLVGALFAVPVIATIKSMLAYLSGSDPFPVLADGGRALTDSPKTLTGDREDVKNPPRIGDATPHWLATEVEQGGEGMVIDPGTDGATAASPSSPGATAASPASPGATAAKPSSSGSTAASPSSAARRLSAASPVSPDRPHGSSAV